MLLNLICVPERGVALQVGAILRHLPRGAAMISRLRTFGQHNTLQS